MMAAFAFVIGGALVTVLNRRMKSVHFSVIGWNFAFVAWSTLFLIVMVEYILKGSDKEKYPYDTIRFLTYNRE